MYLVVHDGDIGYDKTCLNFMDTNIGCDIHIFNDCFPSKRVSPQMNSCSQWLKRSRSVNSRRQFNYCTPPKHGAVKRFSDRKYHNAISQMQHIRNVCVWFYDREKASSYLQICYVAWLHKRSVLFSKSFCMLTYNYILNVMYSIGDFVSLCFTTTTTKI